MSAALPKFLDPWRAVRNGLAFAGDVSLEQLPRLAAVVSCGKTGRRTGARGAVDYRLRFEYDQDRRALALGRIRSSLRLPCQRCLGDVEIALDVRLRLGLVMTEQAIENLPDDIDPLLVTDARIDTLALIEDELLLALPAIPRHAEGLCQPPGLAAGVAPSQATGQTLGEAQSLGDCSGDAAPLKWLVGAAGRPGADDGAERSREGPHPFAALSGLKGLGQV